MTKANAHVPARKVGVVLPGSLSVGNATIELRTERTANGGSYARRFTARWTKGTAEGDAHIEIRPTSKLTTEIAVTLERPTTFGPLLLGSARRRLAGLFANALAYELETRNIEETDGFGSRRTSAELVKARSA